MKTPTLEAQRLKGYPFRNARQPSKAEARQPSDEDLQAFDEYMNAAA